ncbi:MAG: hypothetical protein A2Z25_11805 [Planctomycetes bacterium RBG_16_55_9]|nr:MAG: hypothetical protein A2Z25_11805 [Planctomycetes bacterium RBG_16_55_9]
MHVEPASLAPFEDRVDGVEGRAAFDGVPLEFGEPKIIIRIDEGVFTLGQRYSAERITVSNSTV